MVGDLMLCSNKFCLACKCDVQSRVMLSGQIITTPHDLTPEVAKEGTSPYFGIFPVDGILYLGKMLS